MLWGDERLRMKVGDVWKNPDMDCVYVVTKTGCNDNGRDTGRSVYGVKMYVYESEHDYASDHNKVVHLTGDGFAAQDWRLLARVGEEIY